MGKKGLKPLAKSTGQYTMYVENDQDGNAVYIGECHPCDQGHYSQPVHRIKKILYDLNGYPAGWMWANKNSNFIFRWTERVTLNYT